MCFAVKACEEYTCCYTAILLFWENNLLLSLLYQEISVLALENIFWPLVYFYNCLLLNALSFGCVCKLQYTAPHYSYSFFSCPNLFKPLPSLCPLFYFSSGSWLHTSTPWPSYESCGPKCVKISPLSLGLAVARVCYNRPPAISSSFPRHWCWQLSGNW